MNAQPINVAVVDDDERVRRALSRLLRAAGFQPVGYASAEEFLSGGAQAETDCMVLDVQLGGMSGFDLQDRLVSRGNVPPIIFITAHDEPEAPARTKQAGYVDFFRKPVPGSALIAAIRQAVGTGERGGK